MIPTDPHQSVFKPLLQTDEPTDLVDLLTACRVVSSELLKLDLEPCGKCAARFTITQLMNLALEIVTSDESERSSQLPLGYRDDIGF